jgi:hypothetical protein
MSSHGGMLQNIKKKNPNQLSGLGPWWLSILKTSTYPASQQIPWSAAGAAIPTHKLP